MTGAPTKERGDTTSLGELARLFLIPGPNSTELAIHIGRARGGWPGLLVAGACFILPAALIVTTIAWAYVRFGALPATTGLLYGVKPVVIAVILQALWGLGRTAHAGVAPLHLPFIHPHSSDRTCNSTCQAPMTIRYRAMVM
jgi:hypothetical protein